MKKVFFIACLLSAACFRVGGQRIKGSDTMLPLSQMMAERFMATNVGVSVTVTGGGSGVGIASLLEGTTDIAQLSRKIRFEERRKLKDNGREVREVVAAYDALAVIVHPSNGVERLTREQLEEIFTGKLTNWKELGGQDLRIIPYARETSSGTYEFFKESVLRNKNYMNGIMSMPATGAIIQSVGQTKGAVGYVGLAYLNREVKAIRVSFDGTGSGAEPTVQNAKSGAYPIVRPLFYYYVKASESSVKPFIDFVLSDDGQAIVSQTGYITVR